MMPHMETNLADAARAYAAAIAEETLAKEQLAAARLRRTQAQEAVEAARQPLADAIVAEARAGTRQKDILTQINHVYTRETVRRICRYAGVESSE